MDESDVCPPHSAPAEAQSNDRRRPGRIDYTNSSLIALFRTPSASNDAPERDCDEARDGVEDVDPLASARGIALGLLVVIPFWAVITPLVRWLLMR